MKWLFAFFLLFLSFFNLFSEEKTTVESETAHYDGHILVLKGHVVVESPMGRLNAAEAILKRDEEGKGGIDFPWLTLSEEVGIFFSKGGVLHCQNVAIDYYASTALLEGNSTQICYQDEIGELHADKARIDYQEYEGKIQPVKITLWGNVQMIGAASKHSAKPSLQYALADTVEYFPDEERMVLKSDEGKTVLFYDKLKEMQLSARTVHAARNPLDGKESVQGIGDVRFIFKQDELEKFKQRFKWESS